MSGHPGGQTPRVLVLGGGLAAVGAYHSMRRAIRSRKLDVTVVLRDNYLSVHGQIPTMVTGGVAPGTILNPARRIFSGAQVHVGEIVSVDLDAHRVTTTRHLDGARFELEYDQLLLTLGTTENLEAYPGLAEHAFKLKRFEDCFALRNHVLEMFELADIETDPEERRRLLTFIVAGGGFSGTEMAGELADFGRRLTEREYPRLRGEERRVVIVHPGPTLLPELFGSGSLERKSKAFPKLADYAMGHVRKLGVELMLETKVVGATPNEVHLSNGQRVPTRTIISAVGTKPSPVVTALPLALDERGRVRTDEFMRAEGHEGVWAAGDCASVPHPHGGTCPPVALWARAQGRHVGGNIARAAAGEELRPFRRVVRAQGVSLGRRTGVGEAFGIGFRGKLAWIGFWTVLLTVIPSWDRRVHMLAEWAISPIVGRDIVQMGLGSLGEFEVRQNLFQPGELIAERARPVRHVHVIVQGEADLVRQAGGAEETLETLGPGSHFGRKWLELSSGDAVRAKSLVRTFALRADQANLLQDVLLSTTPIVARTALHKVPDAALLNEHPGDE
jgi:NADH:ubiquinone reductase (H+-translocating)